MPYIKESQRGRLDLLINPLIIQLATAHEGDVNYAITRIIDGVYGQGGYAVFNRAMGVLECVRQEFYRRRVAPYEDQKKEENGEVYL